MAKKRSLFSPARRNLVARFRNLTQARKAIDVSRVDEHGEPV